MHAPAYIAQTTKRKQNAHAAHACAQRDVSAKQEAHATRGAGGVGCSTKPCASPPQARVTRTHSQTAKRAHRLHPHTHALAHAAAQKGPPVVAHRQVCCGRCGTAIASKGAPSRRDGDRSAADVAAWATNTTTKLLGSGTHVLPSAPHAIARCGGEADAEALQMRHTRPRVVA